MKRSSMKRTPFTSNPKPMRRVSRKRAAYRASGEGKAGLAWMGRVKALPCCICGRAGPSDAHHVICDRFSSARASDFDTIPLCKACHQDGPLAIHNGKASWVERNGPDYDYIEETKRLAGFDPDEP